MATANPRMVLMAREAKGLTQGELSQLTGIPQSRLSFIQNGQKELIGADLEGVAKALDVSPDLLCWDDEVYGFGSASFFHRKQQSLPQRSLRAIQARVNMLRMRLVRVLREVDIEAELSIPRIDVDDVGRPADVARMLRATWRMPMGPVGDLIELIESAGGCVFFVDFGTHRINAISVWHPGSGPVFCLNMDLAPENKRFVLAHELGHMVMHEGRAPVETAEEEADAFAEEFLMPSSEIKPDLREVDLRKAATLKPYWRVPMQSLILRAQHLDIITPARSRSLHAYMNKLGYLRLEPYPLDPELPSLIQEIISLHLGEHGYSAREIASILGGRDGRIPREFMPRGLQAV